MSITDEGHYGPKQLNLLRTVWGEGFLSPGGNDEIDESKNLDVITILNDKKPLNISELVGLIRKASFVLANDTGPAHIAAHTKVDGLALFGYHTTPFKVSIETEKFKTIHKPNLNDISTEEVLDHLKKILK